MRKLVSIQTVRAVLPIEEADAIEVAKILGWSVVIKKGEFQVGEKVVYAEIDSLFPEKEEFEFLRKNKFRIRTLKLRGQVSQGICFPLSILPPGDYEEGQEVTELIGVTKYEPPIPACLDGEVRGMFPSFMRKPDEDRVQILQERLTKNNGRECVYSEKLDGVATSFYLNEDDFGVCSKNLNLIENDKNAYWMMAKKYDVERKLRALGRNLSLQGETIGDGIQKNKYKLGRNERRFYLYNIFDIDKYRYLDYEEFTALAKELELLTVPFLDENFILTDNIDELVELSKGYSVINPTTKREGIVIKEKVAKNDNRFSFKAINPEFLLKFGDE
ncbi:RNA ligase (ATP) [Bacillus sp. M6-12]|uniref:RNA ligase (ATP) n=1 Tax=Bacillus sp. M6-12 TaxID=2054166 RepID=UPI000C77CFCB|nr:RNA ligase (ATP) [Bacillus sp. M6-12]PLS19297.1 RNA ligase (ATP) [Bacillus sp. M6-12]